MPLANQETLSKSFILNKSLHSKVQNEDSFEFVSQAKIDKALALVNGINFSKINAKLENYYG